MDPDPYLLLTTGIAFDQLLHLGACHITVPPRADSDEDVADFHAIAIHVQGLGLHFR